MKLYGWVCLTLTLVGTIAAESVDREERQAGEIAAVVVPILVDVAKALVTKILNNWLNPTTVDVVFIGRSFQVHKDGGTQVTVKDRASGYHVTMDGKSLQDATNKACQELLKILLTHGVMSVDDLHLPPTMPPSTEAPCVNADPDSYCQSLAAKGYCAETNVFHTFMDENCHKTCSCAR